MEFIVSQKVFESLEHYCVGIVAAKGIEHPQNVSRVTEMLNQSITVCEQQFADRKVKEAAEILCYREAFQKLGVNPNKFMSSIEAMLTRIAKKKGFPSINPIVDLGNAISIKYHLPLGAHDLDTIHESLTVRFAEPEDHFIAFGETETEYPDQGELLYVADHDIRTRKWIWRQSEVGKITQYTKAVFFPIDGFSNVNKKEVLAARDELTKALQTIFGCEVFTGIVDRQQPSCKIQF